MSKHFDGIYSVAIGEIVEALYPTHGKMNILRKIAGKKVDQGVSKNGRYVTVQEANGQIRSMNEEKVVPPLCK